MASTYSSNLKIELMGTGENSGTWGNITNTNLGTAFEQAVIGLGNPDYTSDANLTITLTDSNASQAARCLVLNVTSVFGSLTATRELIVPTIQKQYIVQNNTTGGQSITVKTSGGTGITVPNGRKAHLYVDGTNVIQMFDFVDINGGTIDGATVGAASASTGAFTSLTASGATTLNGAVALGDAAGDLITVPGTVNSNLLFTDNTYDIGATGATRPRNLFLAGNSTVGGAQTLTGALTVDSTTDSSSITTGSIQTDGGVGIAKALFVGTTTSLAGALTYGGVTLSNSVTGTGSMVLATSPTLVTPVLGTPASGTVTNLTGTASININGTVGATTANTGAFTTLTASTNINSTRVDPRTSTVADTATLTPDISADDQFNITAQAQALTVAAPIGTPVDGNKLILRILDNGTGRAITWNATYTVIGTTLPTTTTANKMIYVGCIYNSTNTRWDVVAVTTQA